MPTSTPARRYTRRRRLPAELLPLAGVADLLGVGLSTAERLRAAGKIGPRPVNLAGPKWRYRELLAWLARPGPDGELLTATEWQPVRESIRKAKAGRTR